MPRTILIPLVCLYPLLLTAQPPVTPNPGAERLILVVPLTGSATAADDPRRPWLLPPRASRPASSLTPGYPPTTAASPSSSSPPATAPPSLPSPPPSPPTAAPNSASSNRNATPASKSKLPSSYSNVTSLSTCSGDSAGKDQQRCNIRVLLLTAIAIVAGAAYPYQHVQDFTVGLANWQPNGVSSSTSPFWAASASNGGSLISQHPNLAGVNTYEIKAQLTLGSSGGNFVFYLAAPTNALMGQTSANGAFYALEIANPTFTGSSCLATLNFRSLVNGALTAPLYSGAVSCRNGMEIRVILSTAQAVYAFIDGVYVLWYSLPAQPAGRPGIGGFAMPSGNGFSEVKIGILDTTPPPGIADTSVAYRALPDSIDLQWQGSADAGIGTWCYGILRDGVSLGIFPTASFSDSTVVPGVAYTYRVYPIDYHFNGGSSIYVTVTAPPAGTIEGRRTGVRPAGAYWGDAGENIDILSGNVNYSVPLLNVKTRGGGSIPVKLSYDSQNWRKDASAAQIAKAGQPATWKLGRDTGYGFGWKLLAGSVRPVYSSYWTIHHIVYTDASGAEYRLDQCTNGVCSSTEGVYVTYDSNTSRLYFNDGSYWAMGALSSGNEEDAGTRYPTLFQDSNGNQVTLTYTTARGLSWPDSSSRIKSIADPRRNGLASYSFFYTNDLPPYSDPVPHLSQIINRVGSSEDYMFTYTADQTLRSPFDASSDFGTTRLLTRMTRSPYLYTDFTYSTNNSGELVQATLPYGGTLLWYYRDFTYTGSITFREIQSRQLKTTSTGAVFSGHWFQHDDASDASRSFHSWGRIDDTSGSNSGKIWYFLTTPAVKVGLVNQYKQYQVSPYSELLIRNYTWATSASGNPYIDSVTTTQDGIASKTTQTIDAYGNLTEQKLYGFTDLTAVKRTQALTYLSPIGYIRNRLLTASVDGTQMVSNEYDQYGQPSTGPADTPGVTLHDSTYGTSFFARGNVTATTANGITRHMEYNIAGAVTRTWNNATLTTIAQDTSKNYMVPSAISTGGLIDSFTWNTALNPQTTTDPNGATVTYGYDTDFPTSAQTPNGPVGYSYNHVRDAAWKQQTFAGVYRKSYLDGFGRPTIVETGDTQARNYVETRYAPCACTGLGKVERVSMPYAPGTSEANKVWTVYQYDALGRTTTVKSGVTGAAPNGRGTTTYSYSTDTITTTDPKGNYKKFTRDVFGNLVTVAEKNPAGGADLLTTYTYTLRNQLTTATMTRGSTTQTRTFNYDLATGRLSSRTLPESGTTTFTYNAAGQLASQTDSRNQTVNFTYDNAGRVTQKGPYTYTYSGTRLASVSYPTLAVVGTTLGTLTELYAYATGGQVATKTLRVTGRVNNGDNGVVSADLVATYTWSNGRLNTVRPPNGHLFTYSYNSMGLPTGQQRTYTASDGLEYTDTLYSNGTYDFAGRLTGLQDAQSLPQTRTYDELGRLTMSRINGGIYDQTYTYATTQDDGRLVSKTDALSGETVAYQYDTLGRLTRAETTGPQWGLAWTYDGFGNRLTQSVVKGSGPAASTPVYPTTNRLQDSNIDYDPAGNVTRFRMPDSSQRWLTWDAMNRLTTASTGAPYPDGHLETYTYDASNQRVMKVHDVDQPLVTFYGIDRKPMGDYTVNWDSTQVWFTGGGWNASVGFFGLENPNRLQSRGDHYPYGEQKGATVPSFATYTRDTFTNLDYAINRYYSPTTGRFLSPDPYQPSGGPASPGSWNRYSYVSGDPINFNDRRGLFQEVVPPQPPPDPPGMPPGSDETPPEAEVPALWPWEVTGGGVDQIGYDQITTENARATLRKRLDRLGDCARILGGATADDFWAVAKNIKFYDAMPNSPGSDRTQDKISGNGIQTKLWETVQYYVAATLTKEGQVLPFVLLGRDFYNDPEVSRPDTLLHEALHVALNLLDPDLKTYLAQYGFKPTEAGSHDITDWLKKDCPK